VAMRPASGGEELFDVVGFGVNALDMIGVIDGFPQPDTKYPMHAFSMQGGGVTATAMVACARLGLRTRYVGKVGSDLLSRLSVRSISREGVNVRGVIREPDCDGHVSIVLADKNSGQRVLYFRRPDRYAIRPEELDRSVITSGRLLHIDGIDAAAALKAIGWARDKGMKITMDGERIVPGIGDVWPKVDLLVCNPRFLASVTGTGDLSDGLRMLVARGPARVAVTLGHEGALAYTQGRFSTTPGFPIDAVDTNGAGDVFHGACALGELRDWPLDWTLTFASAVAAMKCRSIGGRAGIPTLSETTSFLAERGFGEIANAIRS
jgi:sulfofructose kinase